MNQTRLVEISWRLGEESCLLLWSMRLPEDHLRHRDCLVPGGRRLEL